MSIIRVIALFYSCIFSLLVNSEIMPTQTLSEKEKVILTVAIEEGGYFPFNYNENGELKGFSVDVLNYIEANSIYDFEFIVLPWPRALFLTSQGRVDLVLTLFKART